MTDHDLRLLKQAAEATLTFGTPLEVNPRLLLEVVEALLYRPPATPNCNVLDHAYLEEDIQESDRIVKELDTALRNCLCHSGGRFQY